MRNSFKLPYFPNSELEIETSIWTGRSRIWKDSIELDRSSENGKPFLADTDSGRFLKIFPKYVFGKLTPKLEIIGTSYTIKTKLAWYEYIITILPSSVNFINHCWTKKKKKLKPKINTTLGGLIDKLSYWSILGLIFFAIFICAFLYFVLDKNFDGQGISNNSTNFLDCLYFSAVTFTTLGYGDFVPQGISRILAILEVSTGIFLAALLIGKISSERQSNKLTLIYASINHQKILELINDVNNKVQETIRWYDAHDNIRLLHASKNLYDLVSIIRKYLTVQSLEGELTKRGNDSTLKRLYLSLEKTQKQSSIIITTSGLNQNIIAIHIRIVNSVAAIGKSMKQFYKKNDKVANILEELIYEQIRSSNSIQNQKIVYRTKITNDLIDNINKEKGEAFDPKKDIEAIVSKMGISKRLLRKCMGQ